MTQSPNHFSGADAGCVPEIVEMMQVGWIAGPARLSSGSLGIIHTLMKITLPIIALGLILTGCSKAPSDAKVAKKLPGAWHRVLASPDAKGIIYTFSPDGNFTNQLPTPKPNGDYGVVVTVGTFQVRDGYLIETTTNISGYFGHLPVVERYKILQSDDRELIFVDEKTAKKITIDKDTP